MRRARRSRNTHWYAIATALVFSWLAAPEAHAAARPPQQASTAPSSSPASSAPAKKKSKKRRAKREPSQKAPTPQRISEIQSALARKGYYHGEPNGKWDGTTIAAMQKFQSDNGIDASGKINAPSLQKLGLGSSTAGVSAPKPATAAPAPAVPAPAPPAPGAASPAPAPPPASTASTATSSAPPGAPQPSSTTPKPPQP